MDRDYEIIIPDKGAEKSFAIALTADPTFAKAHSNLGLLRGQNGDVP